MRARLFRLVLVSSVVVGCNARAPVPRAPSVTALTPGTHSDFPIDAGAHGGVDCNSCHGEFDTFRSFTCTDGCHAEAPTTSSHAGIDGFAYDSLQCLTCHPSGAADGTLANHPFPIAARDVHGGHVCGECHTDPADKSVFTCTSACHLQSVCDPAHGSMASYHYESPSCLECHPNGIADYAAFDHTAFPIGAGSKHPLGCTQCHTDPLDRTDTTKLACVSCHATRAVDQEHALVADYTKVATATSTSCLTCHAESQVSTIASHTSFPIAFGRLTHDTKCLGCHDTKRADKPYAADFGAYDCLTCHASQPNTTQAALAAGHASVAGYAYGSASCLLCHPQGVVAAPADHEQHFPIALGSKHAGIGCTECHANLATPTNPAAFRCGTCHQQLDPALITKHTTTPSKPTIKVKASEISVSASATCLRCHADSQLFLTASHSKKSPCPEEGWPPHHSAGCTQCHSGYRSDKPYAAEFTGSTPPGCAQCHENRTTCN